MTINRCNRIFRRMKIHERGTLASLVLATYYKNNPPFTAPVISKAAFEKLAKDYHDTYTAYFNGGLNQKGAWLTAKDALIVALDKIADDVDDVAQGNESIIEEGGFTSIKIHRSRKNIPPVPEIDEVIRGEHETILASCKPIEPNIYYGCILSEGGPLSEEVVIIGNKIYIPKNNPTDIIIDESKGRKKVFTNLVSMTTYYVYFFARNSAGVSLLTDGVKIVCV